MCQEIKPVIDKQIAALKELITHSRDATEFAKKTIHLLQHPERVKSMGQEARKLIETYYSWDTIGKKMNQLYEEEYTKSIKKRREKDVK